MSKFQFIRPCVPMVLAAATLVACGQPAGSEPDRSTTGPAAGDVRVRWQGVFEAPPLAEATRPVPSGWGGVVEPPPLAEATRPVPSGWGGVVEPPPLAVP